MPQTVEKTVKASQVMMGDEVIFPGKRFTELVSDCDPKQKYTYIETDYGQTKIELTADVTVFRQEPTEEERAEQTRRQAIEWVIESQQRAETRLGTSREKLINNLDMRDASWHGRHWASYAEAQIELNLWNYVFEVAEKRDIDLYDAIILVRDQLQKRLLDYGNFLGRSSDQLHNYCTALESETRLKFIRDVDWHV